jgi:phosphate-selective porin
LFFQSVTAEAQQLSPADAQKLRQQIEEQEKTIRALQDALAAQKKQLETLAGPVTTAPLVPAPVKTAVVAASPAPAAAPKAEVPKPAPKWFEKYSFRGYTQIRDNRLYASNPQLSCEQCDKNLGNNTNISFRRARFILSGDVNDRISIYFQPDFASTSGGLNFGQIRDLYFDIALDSKKEFRIRAGQSKVPYGFENLQSSQNRLALDRNDALNSAVANERDIGAFFYWAPAKIRSRFSTLNAVGPTGLKGSGDYGVVALGVFNGQTANRPEANNNLHYVARVTYPWQLKNGQYIEASLQGYTGRYTVTSDQRSTATKGTPDFTYTDQRLAGTFVYYPQPWGFQSEFTIGRGPQFNPSTKAIEQRNLRGGYAQTMYFAKVGKQLLIPFYRFQYYSGGKKQELDARRYIVRDHEIGLEWQQSSNLELVGSYAFDDRTYEDAVKSNNRQKGQLLRLQLQVNY